MKYRILAFVLALVEVAGAYAGIFQDSTEFPYRQMPHVYPGTDKLVWDGDLSVRMLDGAHKFIEEEIRKTVATRKKFWKTDPSSPDAYALSITDNRKDLKTILGIEDRSKKPVSFNVGIEEEYPEPAMMKVSAVDSPELIAETDKYRIYSVKWPVLKRMNGEGLLLQPKSSVKGSVVVLPDADQLPEQLAGLAQGVDRGSQFARHLTNNGYEVLVPVLISRKMLFDGTEKQQTYREWLYRQAFHMGHHIIGYEVQKIIAAVDWFKKQNPEGKVGVAGYGEGGLLAFYSAAIDTRIDAAFVSGYFTAREKVWDEPIYRNVWKLLKQFGDAEIAAMIAPRSLVVEYSSGPTLIDHLKHKKEREVEGLPFTGYKGKLATPVFGEVKAEFDRIAQFAGNTIQKRELVSNGSKPVNFGSARSLESFTKFLGNNETLELINETAKDSRTQFNAEERQKRQVKEIEDEVQELVRDSDLKRKEFFLYKAAPELSVRRWSTRPYHQFLEPQNFIQKARQYKEYFADEVIGTFQDSLLPANARTRKVYDQERFTGYEVVLDVHKDLFATGILLIPKDLKNDERRPVVVTQHGRNDTPHKLVEGNFTAYNDVASKLASMGFVVYVPQNPYRGEDRYRWLGRKANTIGKTFFSFVVAQHDQATRWLGTLPFIDKSRIAFYGLSYGGQTAMRVPAILDAYCLSICAGDFGDWTRKVNDTHYEGSFMNTIEWEMPYFNMGNTFSYAEISYLIFPRPFMVERGHHDLVQPTEWVSYEYGKVRYLYDSFGQGENTEIEYFNGGHSMKGEGTFRFLRKHLSWP